MDIKCILHSTYLYAALTWDLQNPMAAGLENL